MNLIELLLLLAALLNEDGDEEAGTYRGPVVSPGG
jgi:hypothetical protein